MLLMPNVSRLHMPSPVIPMRLLHGSSDPTINNLSVAHCREDNPFGPAIYLTEDPLVAGCYVRQRGAIYEVELQGDPRHTICLDQSWEDQTREAASAIAELLRRVGHHTLPGSRQDARTTIQLADPALGKRKRNQMLHSLGIWLLYGYLDGYEMSGLCDRGVQFAVLHESSIVAQRVYVPRTDG